MASDALRRLAARFGSTVTVSDGNSGYDGYSLEGARVSRNQDARANGIRGNNPDPVVTNVTSKQGALVTDRALKSLNVTGVAAVTAENNKGGNAAGPAAAPGPPPRPDEPGLSPYTIRELASWYIEEAARRRDDPDLTAVGALQNAVDGVLRHRLAKLGVLPEFIAVEFERVMQVVFAVP